MIPRKPRGKASVKGTSKQLIERTFFDEGDTDDDGNVTFESGEFIVKCRASKRGRLICIRKSDHNCEEEYILSAVRDMVLEYENNNEVGN